MRKPPPEEVVRAMGVLLGVIDSARSLQPPAGMTPRAALDRWAELAEGAATQEFGEDWTYFKSIVRRSTAAKSN